MESDERGQTPLSSEKGVCPRYFVASTPFLLLLFGRFFFVVFGQQQGDVHVLE